MPAVKVGTCNYCGTRAALVLRGDKRHELACSTCGAPLHNLKMMPRQKPEYPVERRKHHHAAPAPSHARAMSRPPKKRKKRKSLKRRIVSEIWDIVEDIFD